MCGFIDHPTTTTTGDGEGTHRRAELVARPEGNAAIQPRSGELGHGAADPGIKEADAGDAVLVHRVEPRRLVDSLFLASLVLRLEHAPRR